MPFCWPAPAPAAGAPVGHIPLQQAWHIGPDPYLARVMLPSDGAHPEEGHGGEDNEALVPPALREVVAAIPRRLARPEHLTRWALAEDFDSINVAANAAERLERSRFEYIETQAGEAAPASPLYRLPAHEQYWLATMQQIRLVSALILSIITDGCGLDLDLVKGPAPPIFLPNLPSARAEAAFVAEAVAAGVTAGIMQQCTRGDLICVLPLGVTFNRAGKRLLIWDGCHVNAHLHEEDFCMETLQREGRTLFGDARYGGTVDISAAYHHVHKRQDAIPYLGFEWEGQFYRFLVLPLGLATAPRVFTAVMGHTVRFLHYVGIRLLPYLDDLIFAAETAREALTMGQMLLHILPRFGWLVHPNKCAGCAEPTARFVALGTVMDLAAQQYSVPADKLRERS